MIDGFEKVTEIHPAYLNDFVIRASHRFVATALWGADESIRSAVLRHLPPLTREYILYEIEAYEGRPDDGVEETQLKMLELLCDKANSEFYQESMISPAHFQPTIHLAGNSYEDVVNYVLGLAGKIHAQGMASIVPDISNCPIEFLRLGLELLLLNLPWEEINSILWGIFVPSGCEMDNTRHRAVGDRPQMKPRPMIGHLISVWCHAARCSFKPIPSMSAGPLVLLREVTMRGYVRSMPPRLQVHYNPFKGVSLQHDSC